MSVNREFYKLEDYISDLKKMRSEVFQIIEEGAEKELARAAKYYPRELNHLLVKRNMKSTRILFPFFDLPIIENRNQNINLLDLNIAKEATEQLKDVLRTILRELEDI